jgi:hypothetical protein
VARISITAWAVIAAVASFASPAQAAESNASARVADRVSAERSTSDEVLDFASPGLGSLRSEAASSVLDWVEASRDNGDLPYMVIDKNAGVLFLFDAEGAPLGKAPVLIGVASGDDASPGVGSKKLSEIGPAEKTTPAGRFLAKIGWAAGDQKVLWIDYATSVALHAVVTGNRRERRLERLASPSPEDNRVTFGCINVPGDFYEDTIRPVFEEEGGIVYVLPDTRPLEEVFPRLRVLPYL